MINIQFDTYAIENNILIFLHALIAKLKQIRIKQY